jgi:hypothetical protein
MSTEDNGTRTVATPADIAQWVREARRIADTTTPDVRATALYDGVQAFYDAVKFSAPAMCPEVDERGLMGKALGNVITLETAVIKSVHKMYGTDSDQDAEGH